METAESLKRKISTAEDLKSVVRTMKALAAVSIRQYERAVEALADYNRAVEMGLQIVLRGRADRKVKARPAPRNRLIAVIIGSDQGMCGQLNEQLAAYAVDALNKAHNGEDHRILLAVGAKVASSLEERGPRDSRSFPSTRECSRNCSSGSGFAHKGGRMASPVEPGSCGRLP